MSIITGRGDSGETDLMFSKRIAKTSLRVEALGSVDELERRPRSRPRGGWTSGHRHHHRRHPGATGRPHGTARRRLPEDEPKYLEKKYAYLSPEDLEWVTTTARDYEKRGVRFTSWARPGAEGSLARAGLDYSRDPSPAVPSAACSFCTNPVNRCPRSCDCFSTAFPTSSGSSPGWRIK